MKSNKNKILVTVLIVGLLGVILSLITIIVFKTSDTKEVETTTTTSIEDSIEDTEDTGTTSYIKPEDIDRSSKQEQTDTQDSSEFVEQPRLDLEPYAEIEMKIQPADNTVDSTLREDIVNSDTDSMYITLGNLKYYIQEGVVSLEGYDITDLQVNKIDQKVIITLVPTKTETKELDSEGTERVTTQFKNEQIEPLLRQTVVGVERWYRGADSIVFDIKS